IYRVANFQDHIFVLIGTFTALDLPPGERDGPKAPHTTLTHVGIADSANKNGDGLVLINGMGKLVTLCILSGTPSSDDLYLHRISFPTTNDTNHAPITLFEVLVVAYTV
ncbi:hypothetical protein H0H87_007839, partial [Tephrocybe sp. NHM501043]